MGIDVQARQHFNDRGDILSFLDGPDDDIQILADVAELLRTSPKAVYAMIDRGFLPGVTRVGRRLLIRRDDLLQWLNRNRAPSSKEA